MCDTLVTCKRWLCLGISLQHWKTAACSFRVRIWRQALRWMARSTRNEAWCSKSCGRRAKDTHSRMPFVALTKPRSPTVETVQEVHTHSRLRFRLGVAARRLAARESQNDPGSFPDFALDRRRAAVQARNGFHESQAQPNPPRRGRARVVHTVKAIQ